MKNALVTMLALALFLGLCAPVIACTGCGGRFPAGVNLRLMKMRYQNNLDQRTFPPASKGEAIPMTAPAKTSKTKKAKPKTTKSQAKQK